MEIARKEFIRRARAFAPRVILHNLGHDTCQLDYDDIRLTQEFFPWVAKEIKECAREICEERYLVLNHGGQCADVAEYIFPKIVENLAQD